MALYGWDNCPTIVHDQIDRLASSLSERLGTQVTGIYLHGSLAMGCFNPRRSDLDLLVIITDPLSPTAKRGIIADLLARSRQPSPVEISFITDEQLRPWRYPTPFDLHYSEMWRDRYMSDLGSGAWKTWNDSEPVDPDLAAHITITRARGICLAGQSTATAFPPVPAEDYRASLALDIDESLATIRENPVYAILNCCRTAAYLRDGRVFSKAEGGRWALEVLPTDLHGMIALALAAYDEGPEDECFDPEALDHFTRHMHEALT